MGVALRKSHGSKRLTPHDALVDEYRRLEENIDIRWMSNVVSYTSPVNFKESMATPRHRWFPYKEGFSPSFVKGFIDQNLKNKSGIVFDPFSGVGTTALVAAELGLRSVGFDVSPLTVFAAQTKALSFSENKTKDFSRQIDDFAKAPLRKEHAPPSNDTVVGYFDEDCLSALLRVKFYISNISDKSIRALFHLAFLSIIEMYSTHRKAGNGVKIKTRFSYDDVPGSIMSSVKDSICDLLAVYLGDLRNAPRIEPPKFSVKSCLDEKSYDGMENISCLITSPPYANCFDYSKIYMRELWLGDFYTDSKNQKVFRNASMRSHVHATWAERYGHLENPTIELYVRDILEGQDLWSSKIPDMLSGYFKDMGQLLYLLGRKLLPGARAGFVVSNSFYGGIPIATDLLISQTAEKLGYKTVGLDVYRGMIPSSQQYKLIEDKQYMRESLVILEKL